MVDLADVRTSYVKHADMLDFNVGLKNKCCLWLHTGAFTIYFTSNQMPQIISYDI